MYDEVERHRDDKATPAEEKGKASERVQIITPLMKISILSFVF